MSKSTAQAAKRRAHWVESEGVAQAKMWLEQRELGKASIDMALTTLVTTYVRVATLQGNPPPPRELNQF